MGKTIAMVFGWIFLIIGVLGFIGNPIVGDSGIFHADLNHNLVHIISGLVLLWVSYKATSKVGVVLKVLGVVYLLVALLGFFMDGDSVLGLMAINGADNWLHLVLGLIFIYAGVKAGKSVVVAPASNQPMM